jgi:hypothetical protein
MEREYWAQRRRLKVGPFPSREAAIAAFITAHPFTGPDYMASAPRNKILHGYGTGGAWFDLQWSNARASRA